MRLPPQTIVGAVEGRRGIPRDHGGGKHPARTQRLGAAVPSPVPDDGASFVGRRHELVLLHAEMELALSGTPRVVVVEGEGGIGKSALLEAVAAARRQAAVVRAGGEESERTLAWGLLRALLDELARRDRAPVGPLASPEPGADPLAVGAGLATRLGDLAAAGPVLLVLDDLHWCDSRSAAALLFACRRLVQRPVLVLAAVRPPFPGDLGEGWRRLVGARGRRVRLEGLATADVVALAASHGRLLSTHAAARLTAHTGGHPLWTAALLGELGDDELEDLEAPLPVPRDLAGTIRARHGSLGRPARLLVAAGAVLGQRFDATVAAAMVGVDMPAKAFHDAIRAGLLLDAATPPGRPPAFAFPHSLVRSAVYQDLGPSRRSQLHGEAARLTAGAESLAHLAAAALAPSDAVAAELEAAGIAEADAGRLALAQVQLDAAVRLSPPGPHRAQRVLAAMEVHLWAGEPARARTYAEEAAAQEPGPWRDAVLGALARSEGRFADAHALSLAAWRCLHAERSDGAVTVSAPWEPRDLAAKVAVELAALGVLRMAPDEAVDFALESLAASPAGALAPLAKGLELVGLALGGKGDVALSIAPASPPPATGLHELAARGIVKLWTDDLAGAHEDLSAAVARVQAGEPLRLIAPLAFLADACFRLCRMPEALAHAELACDIVDAAGRDWDCVIVHTRAGYAAAAIGDLDRAAVHVTAIAALARKVGTIDGPLARVRSSVAAASGVALALALIRDDPAALFAAAQPAAALNGPSEPGSFALGPVLAEALAGLGRLTEAEAALAPYEERAAALGRRSALAGAARVRGTILAARGDGAAAWQAFEVALDRARLITLELGRCHLAYGKALARAGEAARARFQLAAARAIFADGGATAFVELADATFASLGPGRSLDAPGLLTPAEHAVARLAARRLSNPEIAEQLLISRKTVEYHLSRVYAKVGVRNRTELARLAES